VISQYLSNRDGHSVETRLNSILLITDSLFAELTKSEGSGLSVRLERPKY